MMKAACCAIGLLCGAFCATVSGKDVTLYKVSKGFHYQQTMTAPTPTILAENGYVFEAQVNLALPGAVTSAIVESTEGTDRVLTADGDDQFEFRNRVNSRNTLDTRYPDGPFTFTINTVHDGRPVVNLPLTGNAYPAAPRIANLAQLQTINANGYVIVRWDTFVGATTADFIQLRIEETDGDLAFETPDFAEAGALDGTATYVILEPGDLDAGKTYQATLRFDKTSAYGITTYVGVPGWSTHHAVTRFSITTSSATAPVISSYQILKGRRFDQQSAGAPVPDTNDEYLIAAEVKFPTSAEAVPGTITPPGWEALPMEAEPGETTFTARERTQAGLDEFYPNGTYTLTLEMPEGTRALTLPINGDAYPLVPRLTNFDPTVEVRADRNLVFEWEPWVGGTAHDFIQLRIEDDNDNRVFETDDFGKNGALNGRATWAILPAGELEPGKEYQGTLQFMRIVTLDDTGGTLGMAAYYSRTKFDIIAGPPDVAGFKIAKGREFKQTGPSVVVPDSAYVFRAAVEATSSNSLQTVILEVPFRGQVPLQRNDLSYSLVETYATQQALDAAFPNGTYRLIMRGANDGLRTLIIDIVGDTYPSAPVINDWEPMGDIFPWFDTPLSWAPFEGGRSRDFILVDVLDRSGAPVFATGDYRQDGSMGGLNTDVMIPAEVLQFNTAYTGRLMFERVTEVEDDSYPGVEGRWGYFSRTRWTMVTTGDGNPAIFNGWSLTSDGSLEFAFPSVVGASYIIEGSSNLVNWISIATVSTTTEQSSCRVQRGAPHFFYRAVLTR